MAEKTKKQKNAEYAAKYYAAHREEINERERKRRADNKEKYREYWQKYYKKKKEKIMKNQAAYWARRLEKLKSK